MHAHTRGKRGTYAHTHRRWHTHSHAHARAQDKRNWEDSDSEEEEEEEDSDSDSEEEEEEEEDQEEEFYRKGWFDFGANGLRIVTSVLKKRQVMNRGVRQQQYFVRFSGRQGVRGGPITLITIVTLITLIIITLAYYCT
jgi:hypothetical protein